MKQGQTAAVDVEEQGYTMMMSHEAALPITGEHEDHQRGLKAEKRQSLNSPKPLRLP